MVFQATRCATVTPKHAEGSLSQTDRRRAWTGPADRDALISTHGVLYHRIWEAALSGNSIILGTLSSLRLTARIVESGSRQPHTHRKSLCIYEEYLGQQAVSCMILVFFTCMAFLLSLNFVSVIICYVRRHTMK